MSKSEGWPRSRIQIVAYALRLKVRAIPKWVIIFRESLCKLLDWGGREISIKHYNLVNWYWRNVDNEGRN